MDGHPTHETLKEFLVNSIHKYGEHLIAQVMRNAGCKQQIVSKVTVFLIFQAKNVTKSFWTLQYRQRCFKLSIQVLLRDEGIPMGLMLKIYTVVKPTNLKLVYENSGVFE